MPLSSESAEPLSWSDLASLAMPEPNRIEGPTSAQATLRLFLSLIHIYAADDP